MNADEIQKIVCRRCYALLDVGDNYCRHCGAPTRVQGPDDRSPAPSHAASIPAGASSSPAGLESPWLVLLMLFLVLGPLALPMLWRSRRFSRAWKIVLTVAVLGLTALVVALGWYLINKTILEPLRQFDLLKGYP